MPEVSVTPLENARNFVGPIFHDVESPAIQRNWNTWAGMLYRCFIPGALGEQHYRQRGITVCERWFSFAAFCKDMGARPDGTTLDRIDVNGHYEPANCRWATAREQARNTRANRWHSVEGKQVLQSDLASTLGLSSSTLLRRSRRGLSGDSLANRERSVSRKLTTQQVIEIRARVAAGESDASVGRLYGCSHTNVRLIRLRRTWANL